MKMWKVAVFAALAAALTEGCKPKPKEIPPAIRAQAATDASEAEFAMQIRDYARAEPLLTHAAELVPEEPRYWLQLGAARKRLNNPSGARKAYERALNLFQAAYKRDKSTPGPLFAQMEVYVLLGKPGEAKSVYDKLVREHGTEPDVKNFVEGHLYEQLLVDPKLKEMAL